MQWIRGAAVLALGCGAAPEDMGSMGPGPLPAGLPPLEVLHAEPARQSPGLTLLDVTEWRPDGAEGKGWLLALDLRGGLAWYHESEHAPDAARMLSNGHLGFIHSHGVLVELERSGKIVRQWAATELPPGEREPPPADAIGVKTDTFHHDFTELPNGNLAVLSTQLRQVSVQTCPNYKPIADAIGGEPALKVIGDVVVEFDPATGQIVQEVNLFELLDPCRRTDRGFATDYWDWLYGSGTMDWTHANTVIFDQARGLMMISLRHSDWLIALPYTPGLVGGAPGGRRHLAWILGPEGAPGDYAGVPALQPRGTPFEWAYHIHAVHPTSHGNLILFDNGTFRPGTNFDPNDPQGNADLPYSRAVEYRIDTTAPDPGGWAVEQVREWHQPPGYSPFMGDANELDNGNILVAQGGLTDPPSAELNNPDVKKWADIAEIDPNGEIVFRARIKDPISVGFHGYHVSRAERIQGFR